MSPAISPAHREPNGRRQRPSVKEIEQAQAERERKEMAVVLSQPHRRGDTSQLCSSAWGRFCIKNKLRRELYDAVERYADTYRLWLMVVAGRKPEGHVSGPWSGTEPAPEAAKRIFHHLQVCEGIMREASPISYPLIRSMAIDCPTEDMGGIGDREVSAVIRGSLALAKHFYGGQIGNHPFA